MKKVEIWWSAQETGICPSCKQYEGCHIIKAMSKKLERVVKPKFDDVMEVVVYMCPEFEPAEEIDEDYELP